MTTNKDLAAALRVLADRIEGCQREMDYEVEVRHYNHNSSDGLMEVCSISDGDLIPGSSGGTHWLSGKAAGCIKFVAFHKPEYGRFVESIGESGVSGA